MRKNITIPCAILCMGLALSLYRAANDYGLRTISLDKAVAAQVDGTSGSGGNTTGGDIVLKDGYYMENTTVIREHMTDSQGYANVEGLDFSSLRPNTMYTFHIKKFFCLPKDLNFCKSNSKTSYAESVSIGGTTGGSTTGGSGDTSN